MGEHDISKERDCDYDEDGLEVRCAERYQDFGVESIYYHPDYTRTKLQNDIALIKLNDSIDFRPLNVKPICLPFGTAATLKSKKVRKFLAHLPFVFVSTSNWTILHINRLKARKKDKPHIHFESTYTYNSIFVITSNKDNI